MIKKIKFIVNANVACLIEWMARRAGKQKRNWLDKIIVSLLNKMVSTKHLENDYMKDEWLESEPSFTIEELENFEKKK
ncbi:MAG: hypothetical protein AAF705_09835 [Bacteroidota bacterium]